MTTIGPDATNALEHILGQLRVRLVEYAASKGMRDRTDDVVQETLTVLVRKYAHVETEADIVRLGYTICKYKILEARGVAYARRHDQLDDHAAPIDPKESAEEILERSQERKRLRDAISRLGRRCQQLFRLRLEETPTAQIALAMNASEATVYVWEHRCRKALLQEF